MSAVFGQNATLELQADTARLDVSICDGWTLEMALEGRCGLGLGCNPQKYGIAHMRSDYWFWANPESALAR